MLSSINFFTTVIIIFILFQLNSSFKIVTRQEWGARPPVDIQRIPNKLSHVIIHHSAIPLACYTNFECELAMRNIQDLHQLVNNWSDIGYNFVIGGNGKIYEGRGFNVIGAHAPGYNDKSIGICLIGDWSNQPPSSIMLELTKQLIHYGLANGFIKSTYILHGHRQVKPTECPGNAFYNIIQKWPHFGYPTNQTIINRI